MIFAVLQQLLNEFFLDVEEDNVSFYAGDLFEPSHFKLHDVFLQTSLINSLQLPFELSAGYVGDVTAEGLWGAVAGWPLEVSISDVCLVLKPNKVQWENELLIRYAKELLVTICHSFGSTLKKEGSAFFTSPAKWVTNRLQTVGTDMIVQLERIHIRVESPRSDKVVAYGLNIPLIRFAPRELEEQILYRRQQPGVTYPKGPESYMSKLLTIENVSFYTDLDARAYWTLPVLPNTLPATTDPVVATLLASHETDTPLRQFVRGDDALERFKECALEPFARDQRRELLFIRVIWVKLDFKRAPPGERGAVLEAVDIATEEIELNLDFDQIAAILEELEGVVEHFKRAHTWQWRPSCIDREHHAPLAVRLSPTSLLPLPLTSDESASLTFTTDKQRKSRLWFRAMWRYAFRCIVDEQRKNQTEPRQEKCEGADPRIWWHFNDIVDKELEETRRQRYVHLYARSLSPAALEIALYGRGQALMGLEVSRAGKIQSPPRSPRRRPLPEFDPLTQGERWELSDFVASMSVYEQRVCRHLAEKELQTYFSAAPPSPTRKISSTMEISVAPADSDRSPRHSRRYSVDCIPPASTYQSATPVSELSTYERIRQRGLTIAFGAGELRHASLPMSRLHSASTSDLPSPTKRKSSMDPLRAWIYQQQQQPVGVQTTSWLEKQLFPAWILNPSTTIPHVNWLIGPVTIRLTEGESAQAQATTKRGLGVEFGVESCSGAILLSRSRFLRILVEFRVGLFHVTLERPTHNTESGNEMTTEYKWISSDYIRSPEDGFFYIGLKYSAQEVMPKPNGRVQFVGNLDDELGMKGRMCIGPIKIDCNEAAMRVIMGQSVADELRTASMDIATSTHFSVLQDAYRSFICLVARLPKLKGSGKGDAMNASPRRPGDSDADDQVDSTTADQKKLELTALRTRVLHAFLLRSSTIDVEVGTLELNLSAYTSHIEKAVNGPASKNSEAPETREDVNVSLPTTSYRLQNRPSMNECILDVAGARIVYRSTKQGRAAVIRHLAHLFKL